MSRSNSTLTSVSGQTNGNQIFQLLADAINEHLPADSIDESKVREIVADEVKAARLPRPIEVRIAGGEANIVESRTTSSRRSSTWLPRATRTS